MKDTKKKFIVLSLLSLIILVSILVYAFPKYSLHYPMTATVGKLEKITMFTDDACTEELVNGTHIDWSLVIFGENEKTYWVKNTGNVNVSLSLVVVGLPSTWTLTWNCEGVTLEPNEVVTATLTLTVPVCAEATYSFDCWIEASEVFL